MHPEAWASLTLGVVQVVGQDRLDLLQRLATQDLRPLAEAGRMRHTLFVCGQGRLQAWAQVLSLADSLLVVTAAATAPALVTWLQRYIIMDDVSCRDVSAEWAGLQAFGVAPPPPDTWVAAEVGYVWPGLAAFGANVMALRPAAAAALAWDPARQLSATALEARRLRAGVPGPTTEYATPINPFELRLDLAIGWNKGCYIGQEVLSRLKSYDKVARLLMGVRAATRPTGPAPWRLLLADGQVAGRLTSWVADGEGLVGLAVVKRAAAQAQPVTLVGTDGPQAAILEERPFWQAGE